MSTMPKRKWGMFSDRQFIRMLVSLTIPIVLQNLISLATQMMDTIMLGAVGQTQLSASSLANQPFFIFNLLIFGLASGSSILNAQYWGKGELEPIKVIISMVVKVAMAVGLLLTVLVLCFPETVMRIYTTDAEVIESGIAYLKIVGWSYLMFGISSTLLCTLRSVALVRIAVVNSVTGLFTNVFLNWVFIFGKLGAPAMGIRGAALATLIARSVELLLVLVYIFFIDQRLKLRPRDLFRFDSVLFKDYLKHGLPVACNEVLWSVGISIQTMILGRLGSDVVSASQIASVVNQFSTVIIFGVANASAVIVGNAIGEGNLPKAIERIRWFRWLAVAMGIFSAGVILLISGPVVSFYNVPAETKVLAMDMLKVLSVIVLFVATTGVGVVGLLRGGGDPRFALIIDLAALWLVAVPAGLLSAFVFHAPVLVVYALTKLDEPLKVLMLLWRMRNNDWITNVTR
ncbi:MAG: MATE family efflux transporter [Oscillospiraceae bacterium]|nr:MATE family efflux transporter [Oscillospiraceae bacterium]